MLDKIVVLIVSVTTFFASFYLGSMVAEFLLKWLF
jgi:hypothetical protein